MVLGISLAVVLICLNWSAAAESKAKGSSVTSDRQATPARVARKEDADDERPRKARAQKDDSDDKEPARKTRAKKDDSDDDAPARKARAKKDDSDEKGPARKTRAKKDDSDDDAPARKARAKKSDDDEASAQKARAKKNDSDDDPPARRRAQKETSQKDSDGPSETLAALKQQVRDLRKQVADMERLRAELAAVKAQVRGSARAAAEPSPDNGMLAALKQQLRDLLKQVADTERLRAELADIKAQVHRSAPKVAIWGGVPLTLPPALRAPPSGSNPVIEMATLRIPDVRDNDTPPLQPPVNPATASLPAVIREQLPATRPPKSAVEEAKAYLVKTAIPGGTMMRQGVSVAIDRLHPGFAVKLAEAVKRAREEGLTEAGVFSAYRPPAFGIGGFADKFDSLHSYGLATDITGIGGPGSASAHRWHQIVMDVGLYLPYGPDHRVEFNHTQFIPMKVAPRELRETITAQGPIDLHQMWLASGVDAYVTEPPAVAAAGSPVNDASAAPEPAAKPVSAPAAEPPAPQRLE